MSHKGYRIHLVDAKEAKYAAVVAMLHAKLFPRTIFPYPHYGDWWVAYDLGKMKAIGFAHLEPTNFYPNSGYFGRVGVLPEARGHGLQRRLMRAVEKHAKKVHGYEALYSDTTDVPHSAANFERMGWAKFDPLPSHRANWAKNERTVFWRKTL